MSNFTLIKLKFNGPVHFGAGREDEYDYSPGILHSDTLSAALASVRASLGKTQDLKEFLSSFCISSAFPFVGERLFLPKPMSLLNVDVKDREEKDVRKQLKTISYIEMPLWKKLVAGEELTFDSAMLQKEYLTMAGNDFKVPFRKQLNQRVSVSREGYDDSDPFYFEWIFFRPDAGLYCMTDAEGDSLKELMYLFAELGESGLGTDRNVGGGHFDVTSETTTLPDVNDADYITLLSLYLPTADELTELDLTASQYSLAQRGGYISGSTDNTLRHLRKKSVNMFTEGSLFPMPKKELRGCVVDLHPEWNSDAMHPVWRSGIPFYLPIRKK